VFGVVPRAEMLSKFVVNQLIQIRQTVSVFPINVPRRSLPHYTISNSLKRNTFRIFLQSNYYKFNKIDFVIKVNKSFEKRLPKILGRNFATSPPNDSSGIIVVIIIINLIVFLLWKLLGETRTGREFMFRHFTVSWMNLLQFRVWTLITSGFSQESLLHLATNMVTLWFLGDEVAMLLGRRRFRNFYLRMTKMLTVCL